MGNRVDPPGRTALVHVDHRTTSDPKLGARRASLAREQVRQVDGRRAPTISEHTLERSLGWEPPAAPTVLTHVVFPVPPFVAGMRKLTIQRDEQFRLSLLAEGVLANRNELMLRREASDKVPAG